MLYILADIFTIKAGFSLDFFLIYIPPTFFNLTEFEEKIPKLLAKENLQTGYSILF